MQPLPVPYRSNPAPYKLLGEPKVINAYAEQGSGDNKAEFYLLPTAGIKTFGSETGGACRGLIYLEKEDIVYAVLGSRVHKVESDATITQLGFIAGTDTVYMARNDADDQDVVIVGDGKAFVIKDEEVTFQRYTSTTVASDGTETVNNLDFVGVTYCGGYFVFWLANGRFYVSDLQSTTVNELNFATAEGDPDGLTAAFGIANTLYLFGPASTEIWRVTGADFPFQKIGGAYFRFGTNSPHTIKEYNNGVALVGSDDVVYMLNGSQYTPISSNEVSRLIADEADKSKLVAFTHQRGQHKFYTLQGTGWTREYNATTGAWHNREDVSGNQWHCEHHVKAWGKDIYGDRQVGQLFESDYSLFTDDGDEIPWGFYTQIIHDTPNGLQVNRIELDMETGDGESVSDDGKVMLQWSKNNGRTFSERQLSLGKTGEYNKRVRTGSIGQCDEKGMVLGVIVTDPVVRSLGGLYGDVERVDL